MDDRNNDIQRKYRAITTRFYVMIAVYFAGIVALVIPMVAVQDDTIQVLFAALLGVWCIGVISYWCVKNRCPACRKLLRVPANFCPHCGVRFRD